MKIKTPYPVMQDGQLCSITPATMSKLITAVSDLFFYSNYADMVHKLHWMYMAVLTDKEQLAEDKLTDYFIFQHQMMQLIKNLESLNEEINKKEVANEN